MLQRKNESGPSTFFIGSMIAIVHVIVLLVIAARPQESSAGSVGTMSGVMDLPGGIGREVSRQPVTCTYRYNGRSVRLIEHDYLRARWPECPRSIESEGLLENVRQMPVASIRIAVDVNWQGTVVVSDIEKDGGSRRLAVNLQERINALRLEVPGSMHSSSLPVAYDFEVGFETKSGLIK